MTDVHRLLDEQIYADLLTKDQAKLCQQSEYSDDALARRFTDLHKDKIRYVDTWGRWLIWDGQRWTIDETQAVTNLARELVRDVSREVLDKSGPQRFAANISSSKTVSAIERLVRSDRQHAALVSDWDQDPWLLNTSTGTVDLKTGQILPHNHQDHITKITAVGPDRNCSIDRWLSFLERIFSKDERLIEYIRRVLGYSLTGSTQEHALFFGYGTGANGKSVLLGTWHKILGDYSVIAPISTFTASDNERHPTELAMLRGARLVTAQETEDGKHWAEAKIKWLTGGDPVQARFMRQDFFKFQPAFKLIIAGNHKPSLRNVDEAIKRRLNFIPFNVTIPPVDRDIRLTEKLQAEWPGILAWAIEGCLEWQRVGLQSPSAVVEATEGYLSDEDAIGRFMAERCERGPDKQEELKSLYPEWKRFCESSGEPPTSEKSFSQKLENHGFRKRLHSGTRRACFQGLRLKVPEISPFDIG